jgi:hypothetical protein
MLIYIRAFILGPILVALWAMFGAVYGLIWVVVNVPVVNMIAFIPAVVLGGTFYLLDVLFNWTGGSFIFWELPKLKEPTLTGRMSRHIYQPVGKHEQALAKLLCKLLQMVDGVHCVKNGEAF